GIGDIYSPLMFVGEAPGNDEDRAGEPFVGRAGTLLTKIIETMGLSRDKVFIGNILKCRPDTPGVEFGNRKPTADEMKQCLPFLLRQIEIIKPRVIVTLGATAMEGLFQRKVAITKERGHFLEFNGTPVMPTFHPAYVLRNNSIQTKRMVWEDMLMVMERLKLPISQKQRSFFT
ncbi:MAG: uracil-DNA glycosylase, partial [Verrucomicrobia bacterium]|nr:uracil-DNA glycosylase [Verrucomicrobiota bacterium]